MKEHEVEAIEIKELATEFRNAIESLLKNQIPCEMKDFPLGACGDASLLLGAYLSDQGILGFKYATGKRKKPKSSAEDHHGWLIREGLVVDITADQFADAPAGVIVEHNSSWHQKFKPDLPPSDGDFRNRLCSATAYLAPTYSNILSALPRQPGKQ
ncbi:hypothetical protein ACF8PL_19075 [Delftia sp. WSY_4]|uniref:hypothetical protein n=1 Tax=unclassified Delftia TaxID=2613839 RepID=UPI00370BB57C